MRLLVVTEHYWPEQFRITDLASELVSRGHSVRVLTGMPSYPRGRYFKGYRIWGPYAQRHQGVEISRVPIIPRQKGRGWQLVLNYASYAASATARIAVLDGDFDAALVFQPTPVTTIAPALLFRMLHRVPVAVWVQDLWPETIRAAGFLRSPGAMAGARWLSSSLYRACDLVLGQSRAFVERLAAAGVPRERLAYLPNWAEPLYEAGSATEEGGAPGTLHVMFAGNIGRVQAIETVLAAAALLRDEAGIRWTFVGDGPMKGWAEAEVGRLGLGERVRFLGHRPVTEMPGLFVTAGALLVSLGAEETMALVVPSKLQSYLAAGRPVLGSLNGEGARIIEESGAGFASPAEDAAALASNVLRLSRLPGEQRAALARAGRAYYSEHFNRAVIIDRLVARLSALAGERRRH